VAGKKQETPLLSGARRALPIYTNPGFGSANESILELFLTDKFLLNLVLLRTQLLRD
jgi:hypothetical protein